MQTSFRFFSILLSSALLMSGVSAKAAVWVESQTWDDSWEEKYSDWIRFSFNEEIFVKGKYAGISTDCAHAVYVARMIFAYENKLPFVIKDSTGGSVRISNRMSRWDGQAEVDKVKKFAVYIGSMVSTKTLPNDTYPIKIDRNLLKSGAVWSRVRVTEDNFFRRLFGMNVDADPGHAEIVKDVSDTGVISLIGSTVPKEVRKLITTSSLVFMPIEKTTGFRKWMQPDDYGKKPESLKGYSLEQFSMGKVERRSGSTVTYTRRLDAWTKEVQERLALREESEDEYIQRGVSNLCTLATARVAVVAAGESFRKKLNGECMSPADYENYSTPSRDKRIIETLDAVKSVARIGGFLRSNRLDKIEKYFANCQDLQISADKRLTAYEFAKIVNDDRIVSDPNETLMVRWGLEAKSERICPTK